MTGYLDFELSTISLTLRTSRDENIKLVPKQARCGGELPRGAGPPAIADARGVVLENLADVGR